MEIPAEEEKYEKIQLEGGKGYAHSLSQGSLLLPLRIGAPFF